MNWGIVTSVLVANIIFILTVIVIGVSLFGLVARNMKKQVEAGGIPKCPMPGCPFHGDIEDAIEAATSSFVTILLGRKLLKSLPLSEQNECV